MHQASKSKSNSYSPIIIQNNFRFRFNLHKGWTTTIFILNLAFADMLYCIVNLPFYAMTYLKYGWFWGSFLCKASTGIRYITAFADWMSLGMVAVSRCLCLTKPDLSHKIFSGMNGKLVIISIWIYANVLVAPMYFQKTLQMGTFGYNCKIGKCDFVPTEESQAYPRVVL